MTILCLHSSMAADAEQMTGKLLHCSREGTEVFDLVSSLCRSRRPMTYRVTTCRYAIVQGDVHRP